MEVRITTLCENTAGYGGFLGEWGLSILVEADGKKILLDAGPGASTIANAHRLGVDLSKIDVIVLSHGHADHTGGLAGVLEEIGGCDVIAHPSIWAHRYVRHSADLMQRIGVPFSQRDLEERGARFILSRQPVKITDRIMTSGEIEMTCPLEKVDDNLFVQESGSYVADPVADDMALIIDAGYGLVVLLGCAHRGLINTLRHAQRLTGVSDIYAALGGTHLVRATSDQVGNTIRELRALGIQRLGVSHCTGFDASTRLASEFKGSFFLNNSGARFSFPA